jgi:MYXO-CTERM domain-containing protein
MEVFFKNLTSDETSIEKLVEDLAMLANDVEDLVRVSGANLGEESRQELMTAVQKIKARCESIKEHAVAGVRATDRAIRTHPYSSLGVAFTGGLVLGALLFWRRRHR